MGIALLLIVITIEDNVFGEKFHSEVLNYCKNDANYKNYKVGDKNFYCDVNNVGIVEEPIVRHLESSNKKIKPIFSYYRIATNKLDTDWRIHCDINIFKEKPTNACVYYISSNNKILNGTAIWKHKKYGRYCPDISDEEFDRLILEDSNNLINWDIDFVISGDADRLITYPSNVFHSKYPKKSWGENSTNCRIIFCMFYKEKSKKKRKNQRKEKVYI